MPTKAQRIENEKRRHAGLGVSGDLNSCSVRLFLRAQKAYSMPSFVKFVSFVEVNLNGFA
jgi:hypothetical protein